MSGSVVGDVCEDVMCVRVWCVWGYDVCEGVISEELMV